MDMHAPLAHLESFVRSAQAGSFSEAARRLGITPAAVSKNVARLEARLGVRLFQRSTRRLALTEAGTQFLREVAPGLDTLAQAIEGVAARAEAPAGVLKVSMGLAFGRRHVMPLLAEFLRLYPGVVPDWHFDNRQVDLIAEGFDAAIGGGIDLPAGVVARELARTHVVAVAAPAYMAGRALPTHPRELAALDGLPRRSQPTGRLRPWTLREGEHGEQATVEVTHPRAVFDDPEAVAEAARAGLGVALLPMVFVEADLRAGTLLRLLPGWRHDSGGLWLYFPSRRLLPAKTRAFVDFVVARFEAGGFAARMRAD